MEITLALILISSVSIIAVLMIGYGICEKEGDYIGIGLICMTVALVAAGVRGGSIQDEEEHNQRVKMCIEDGREVEKIFNKKVCIL